MKGIILVYILTCGGAVAALIKPFYALVVYLIFAILRPELLWHWSLDTDSHVNKIVAIALIAGWAIHGFGNWNFGQAKPIVISLFLYWLWIAVSATTATDYPTAFTYTILHSKIFLPVLIGMTLIRNRFETLVLAWTLILTLGYIAFEANGMYFNGRIIEFRESGMLGIDNNSICIALSAGTGLSVTVALTDTRPLVRILALVLSIAMAHVSMFGHSRGGMLGVLATGAISFILAPKSLGTLLCMLAGCGSVLYLANADILQRLTTVFAGPEQRDLSAQSRLDLWAHCWDSMIRNPITGLGPDHWPLTAASYGWPEGKEAHSIWFNCGAELGFIGLGLLIALYYTTIRSSLHILRIKSRTPNWDQLIPSMVISSLGGFAVSASFVSLDALEVPYYIIMIAVGFLKNSAESHEQLSGSENISNSSLTSHEMPHDGPAQMSH